MLPQAARVLAEERQKADGDRLRSALQQLGLSQTKAAELSGVRQGWLTSIISGQRSLVREDLRALASIGVSADYLLGFDRELIRPGETRTAAALERDVAARVVQDALSESAEPDPWIREVLTNIVVTADLLGALVRLVRDECEANREWLGAKMRLGMAIKTLDRGDVERAQAELSRAYAEAAPPPGRVLNWRPVTFSHAVAASSARDEKVLSSSRKQSHKSPRRKR